MTQNRKKTPMNTAKMTQKTQQVKLSRTKGKPATGKRPVRRAVAFHGPSPSENMIRSDVVSRIPTLETILKENEFLRMQVDVLKRKVALLREEADGLRRDWNRWAVPAKKDAPVNCFSFTENFEGF